MKLGVLFSGGKDSCFAAFEASKKHEIVCLITVVSENKDSYMFHTPNIEFAKEQAKAMEIPILFKKTKGEKEKELQDLLQILEEAKLRFGIEGIVTGAVNSKYQASRIQNLCDRLKLTCLNPLGGCSDHKKYLQKLINNKFEIIISGIAAYPLTEEFLGIKINEEFIKKIEELNEKYQISYVGEGGEFESFVLDGPLFIKKLEITKFETQYDNYKGILQIKEIQICDK